MRRLAGQLALWTLGAAVFRLAVVPAESCPPVTRAEAERSVGGAVAWLERGVRPDGRFLYGYDREAGRVSAAYNTTRHAGVLAALYQAGRFDAGDAGLRHALANLVENEGWTAFAPAGEDVNAGANALLLAALVHRRDRTGDPRHDALAGRIADFLEGQVQPDGSVLQFWSPTTRAPVPGLHGKFATGEVLWALALAGRERTAHRVARYLALRRDRAEGYAVRQADHWAAYGLSELSSLDDVELAYARRLAGYFGFLVRFESQRTGGRLNPLIESGARRGTVGEGAAALHRLAARDPRLADVRDDLAERVRCVAGILTERQQRTGGPLERGAWFADGYTQMDDQQHGAAALLGALEALP